MAASSIQDIAKAEAKIEASIDKKKAQWQEKKQQLHESKQVELDNLEQNLQLEFKKLIEEAQTSIQNNKEAIEHQLEEKLSELTNIDAKRKKAAIEIILNNI